ncbi:MAG: NADH-quinone oxidoreductase subunit NuoN [candidate division Zixibacteria bacterium]|nr:NADH-quinone oxidoreductase subunit NuoN [candidate division Zixibacteria bacterium]
MNVQIDLSLLYPHLFLLIWALLIFAIDFFMTEDNRPSLGYLSIVGLIITAILSFASDKGTTFWGAFRADTFSLSFNIIFIGSAILTIASAIDFVKDRLKHHGEFYGLILLSTLGMMFLASSSDLLSLYVSLELATIALFVLVAFMKRDLKSTESGLKYLILGAASSAILVYGISLLYGLTGTLTFAGIAEQLNTSFMGGPLFILSIILIIAGLSFKLAAVPFHMWCPDVYEGAPTPVTAYLSVASKAAGLAAMIRIFFEGLHSSAAEWIPLILTISALAMVLGNVVAVRQHNIKRLLAYSSIAQIGYILVAFIAVSELATTSMILYMIVYMFANIGAFIVVITFYNRSGSDEIIAYAGLSKRSPFLAISMVIFLLSLVGIPPMAGFVGKFYLFAAAIQKGYYWIVVLGVLTSVISLYYYMMVAYQMYFKSGDDNSRIKVNPTLAVAILIALAGTLFIGVYPEPVLSAISGASVTLF